MWSALLNRNKIIDSEKAQIFTNNENHQFRILVVIVTVFKGDIMREINRMGEGGLSAPIG